MKAGIELDKLIIKHLYPDATYGFNCPSCGSRWFGTSGILRVCHDEHGRGCHWSGEPYDAPPQFSEDPADAVSILDLYRERGMSWIVTSIAEGAQGDKTWEVSNVDGENIFTMGWSYDNDDNYITARALTLPLAICHAALAAEGYVFPEGRED